MQNWSLIFSASSSVPYNSSSSHSNCELEFTFQIAIMIINQWWSWVGNRLTWKMVAVLIGHPATRRLVPMICIWHLWPWNLGFGGFMQVFGMAFIIYHRYNSVTNQPATNEFHPCKDSGCLRDSEITSYIMESYSISTAVFCKCFTLVIPHPQCTMDQELWMSCLNSIGYGIMMQCFHSVRQYLIRFHVITQYRSTKEYPELFQLSLSSLQFKC